MRILIKNKLVELIRTQMSGREGHIYRFDSDNSKLVKIYNNDRRTAYYQRKVTAIINKMRQIDLGGVENYISYPETAVYDSQTNGFCGFSMKNFNNHTEIFNLKYDLFSDKYINTKLNDKNVKLIISGLFTYLEALHSAGIILGDINSANIMVNNDSLMPCLIDIDAAQIGTYYSNTRSKEYTEPNVRTDGHGRKKHFIYSTNSDIFALAVVCYEFIVGVHPYCFQTLDPTDTEYKKELNISFLNYFEGNSSFINGSPLKILENTLFETESERLKQLKIEHTDLYDYFRKIFIDSKRYYFSENNRLQYRVSMKNSELEVEYESVNLIPNSKEDPEELKVFLKQFNLTLY